MIVIRAIASALPKRRIDNDTVASWCGSDAAFLKEKVGLEERRFLDSEQSCLDLAAEACNALFAQNPELSPASVQLCLLVGQVHDQIIPHSSALLQHRLGLPEHCACADIGLACSGYVYGLSLARGMMEAEGLDNALLVTCDPYSRIMGTTNRNTVPLFGDAATATWLSRGGSGLAVGLCDMGTDGSRASHLWLAAPEASGPLPELSMNGRGIFQFAMTRVPVTIRRCLERNGLTDSDLACYLFHQANAFILEQLRKHLNLSPERCPVLMGHTGNTVSSSLPLALNQILPDAPAACRILLCGFGGGLSWASTILTRNND